MWPNGRASQQWRARRPRHAGYLLALLAQGGAVGLTLLLCHLLPAFAFPSALPLLAVVVSSLRWGTGPSLLATLVGAVLVTATFRPAPVATGTGVGTPADAVDALLFLAVGLSIGLLARRTERAASAQVEQARRLQALQTVTDTALAHLDREALQRAVLARITEVLGVDNTALLLLDEAAQQLVVHLAQGPEDALAGRVRVPLGQGIAGRIAASRQPLIVPDTAAVEAVNPFLHQTIRSLMGVPLLMQGRVLGVLHVGTTTPRRFTLDDLELLRLLADRVALALDNAHEHAAAQAAQAQAEQAVRLRDDVLTLATHDLRAPLAGILGRAQLVQHRLRRGATPDGAWLDAQMQAIGSAVQHLSATIEELSDVARLQVGQALDLVLEDVDVTDLVRAAVAESSVSDGAASPRVAVAVPAEAVVVRGDRARLGRVLQNLLDNAVKYSPAGSPIAVAVQGQEHWAVITVRDQGVGIPAEDLPHLFTRYFRASTARGIPGTGLGLAGAKTIVEQHGGQITLESVLGQGTTVTVRLPHALDAAHPR